jgi:hypothetical protein
MVTRSVQYGFIAKSLRRPRLIGLRHFQPNGIPGLGLRLPRR